MAEEVVTPEKEEDTKVMGRPRKEIDYDQFEKLCQIQCTEKEIAYFFDMDTDTLNARCKEHYGKTFSDASELFRTHGKISLRREQYRSAITSKNIKMQIHLGRHFLGQREKFEQTGKIDVMHGITFKDWMIYHHRRKGLIKPNEPTQTEDGGEIIDVEAEPKKNNGSE